MLMWINGLLSFRKNVNWLVDFCRPTLWRSGIFRVDDPVLEANKRDPDHGIIASQKQRSRGSDTLSRRVGVRRRRRPVVPVKAPSCPTCPRVLYPGGVHLTGWQTVFWKRFLRFGKRKQKTLSVRVNGEIVGSVTVDEGMTDFEIQMEALALPEVKTRIGERTVMGLSILGGWVVDISA